MSSGREFERDEERGKQAGASASGSHDGQRDEAFFEDRAQDAAQWLAGCRAARQRGEPDHTVGAADVADPALAALMSELTTAVGHMVAFDPVGRDGKDLLEYCAGLHTQLARLASVTASATRAYDNSGEWVLKARTPAARIAHRCQLPPTKVRGEVRLGRHLTTMPHTDTALAEVRCVGTVNSTV